MPRELRLASDENKPKWPRAAKALRVEKWRTGGKHYVYVIEVTMSNGDRHQVYRRYSRFDELHAALVARCSEADSPVPPTSLPSLPGKRYIARSAVRTVAENRLPVLADYLSTVLSLPEHVSRFPPLVDFLLQSLEDAPAAEEQRAAAAAANNSDDDDDLDGAALEEFVTTVRPASPVLSEGDVNSGPRAQALFAYRGGSAEKLLFEAGVVIRLLRDPGGGWLEGELHGRHGIFPKSFVEIIEDLPPSAGGPDGPAPHVSGRPRPGGPKGPSATVLAQLKTAAGKLPAVGGGLPLPRRAEAAKPAKDAAGSSGSASTSGSSGVEHGSAAAPPPAPPAGSGLELACFHKGAWSVMQVPDEDRELIVSPNFKELYSLVRGFVADWAIVMNFRDEDGDLVSITSQDDVDVLVAERASTRRIELVISARGDFSVYNTGGSG